MTALSYLLTSTICLSLCFGVYKLIYRNERNFKQLRYFLLASIFISLFLPLSTVKIETGFSLNIQNEEISTTPKISQHSESPQIGLKENNYTLPSTRNTKFTLSDILLWIYFSVTIILISRILLQLLVITYEFAVNKKAKRGNVIIVENSKLRNTFSFFNLIFLNHNSTSKDDFDKILAHENVHVSQLHSFDLILIELLAAVMWFNPFIWMVKKEMQLVHEYLADEGALSTGIDRLGYQALLINQITEESLICLSSSFNHSLIKKRMIMMTKSKFNHGTKLKILALIPLAAVLFLAVACINGQKKNDVVAAVAPVKMNVLYMGVDNPLKIAVSGYKPSELTVSIDNGTIEGQNGEYVARPKENVKEASIIVSSNGKEIQKTNFRVRYVPDPVAKIAGIKGSGSIDKSFLLQQTGPYVELENFEFDLSFKIVEFTVSTVSKGYTYDKTVESDKFSDQQKELIKECPVGKKVYIENVKAVGPDGKIRLLSSIALTIK